MARLAYSLLVTIFATITYAQMETCADVGCDLHSQCFADKYQGDNIIGVTNFTTPVSSHPLQWTVSYLWPLPASSAVPDGRAFFIGQSSDVDLRSNASVTACALFFSGISPKLKFNNSSPALAGYVPKDSCSEALTDSCAADWLHQAQVLASYSTATNFTCQRLVDALEKKPPKSCSVAKSHWGTVFARSISGTGMPPPEGEGCNMTQYPGYSQTRILDVNATQSDHLTGDEVTPIMTFLRSTLTTTTWTDDVHLSCVKPVQYDIVQSSANLNSGVTGRETYSAVLALIMFVVLSVIVI